MTETVTLHAVWRLDCGEDADPVVGKIVSAAPGLAGRVLLVDSQLCQVLVIGPEGDVERTVGRCGEGPGELSGAYRALQLADGRIGIAGGIAAPGLQFGGQGRVVLLDEEGVPAATWRVGGEQDGVPICSLRELRHAAGHVLAVTARKTGTPPKFVDIREVSLIDPVDGARTVILRDLQTDDMTQALQERPTVEPLASDRSDVSACGRVALAPERDRWLVVVRNPDGSGLALERPWAFVARSAADITQVRRALGDPAEYIEVLEDHPAIGRLRWRPDGCLWVEPGGPTDAPGAFACFDEISATGELLRRVRVVVPNAAEDDELLLLEDGRFVLLRGFAAAADDEPTTYRKPEVLLLDM